MSRIIPMIFYPVKLSHRLFEAVGGSNSKPPIIFLHGLLDSKDSWKNIPQIIADETQRKVYTYDARNHGETEHTMVAHFDNNYYDLMYFLHTMGIEKSILVGNNMGGMTAVRAVLEEPKKFESAFIVEMHTGKIPDIIVNRYLRLLQVSAVKLYIHPDAVSVPNLSRVYIPPPIEELRKDEELMNSVHLFRCFALMDALIHHKNGPPPFGEKGNFSGPSYFIYGAKSDMKVLDKENEIRYYFSNAEFIRFEDVASNLVSIFPTMFINTLLKRIPME